MKTAPIGIFDSGIGGLTVAGAIHRLMPHERLIYFGDTAHLPYGDKSRESIIRYSEKITDFLVSQGCKAVVIACNTAASYAFKILEEKLEGKIPVFNVIDPMVERVLAIPNVKKIGIIGTKGTINSRVYPRKIKRENSSLRVGSLSTPLLVPMIEEGFFNNKISRTIIHAYLSKRSLSGIQALVLACTHYPLIKGEIESFYKHGVEVIDSAEVTANYVKEHLNEKDWSSEKLVGKHHFYVSDFTPSFEKSVNVFFKESIHLEYYPLWKEVEI
ncbi:MAG: glutamate racemase [Sphingobacteriales bacterium]|jgi:glutamate racemase